MFAHQSKFFISLIAAINAINLNKACDQFVSQTDISKLSNFEGM